MSGVRERRVGEVPDARPDQRPPTDGGAMRNHFTLRRHIAALQDIAQKRHRADRQAVVGAPPQGNAEGHRQNGARIGITCAAEIRTMTGLLTALLVALAWIAYSVT